MDNTSLELLFCSIRLFGTKSPFIWIHYIHQVESLTRSSFWCGSSRPNKHIRLKTKQLDANVSSLLWKIVAELLPKKHHMSLHQYNQFMLRNSLNIIKNGFIFNFKENVGSSLILSVVLLIYC